MTNQIYLLEKRVLNQIRCQGMLSKGDRVVAAVSGGTDSVCLLYILHKYREELGIEIHVAHLDHGLRGEQSDADAKFVLDMAQDLELPVIIEKRDVLSHQRRYHLTLEEAAREVRYRFLSEVAGKLGAAAVAVAHTWSDHVETVMLHLLRGSGLSGLVGLKEVVNLRYKRIECLKIIRPLISLTRAEVENYCRENRIGFRTDLSNESLTPTRNRIRLRLLPEIRRDYNPRIDEAIARLSRLATDDLDFIAGEAGRAADRLTRFSSGVWTADRAGLLQLHPALRRVVLQRLLSQALGSPKDIESVHIEEMMDIAAGAAGRAVNLPDGLVCAAGYQELLLGRDLSVTAPLPDLEGEFRLNIPGETEFSGWRVSAEIIEKMEHIPPDLEKSGGMLQFMDFDRTGDELCVRSRRDGDRFQPLGMARSKKLKDFFIDAKVPRLWRSRIPVVVSNGQIVWVAGCRLDERVRVTAATARVLKLEFCQIL